MPTPLEHAPLACPLDGLALSVTPHGFGCPDGHSFDVASTGYANLLPVQFKSSKDPGDSKAMVQARRRVMDAGVFQPLADIVCVEIVNCLKASARSNMTIVDAGCGEGFFTNTITRAACNAGLAGTVRALGIDISKWAVQSAAKRHPALAWAVANNRALPVMAGAADVITSLFGFETWEPWAQHQTVGQYVVTVDAGRDHLIELRRLLYTDVTTHDAPDNAQALSAGYREVKQLPLHYSHTVTDTELLNDVIDMTPHRFRATAKTNTPDIAAPMTLTIDAVVRIYQR